MSMTGKFLRLTSDLNCILTNPKTGRLTSDYGFLAPSGSVVYVVHHCLSHTALHPSVLLVLSQNGPGFVSASIINYYEIA